MQELSKEPENQNVIFLKVDVDEAQVGTSIFMKNSDKVLTCGDAMS